jgi:hypothetical protein
MLTLRDAQVARLQAEVREAQAEARHWRRAFQGLWRYHCAVVNHPGSALARDALIGSSRLSATAEPGERRHA